MSGLRIKHGDSSITHTCGRFVYLPLPPIRLESTEKEDVYPCARALPDSHLSVALRVCGVCIKLCLSPRVCLCTHHLKVWAVLVFSNTPMISTLQSQEPQSAARG